MDVQDIFPACFASVSIGTPETPLPDKLRAISSAGFRAIELGFPDLLSFASSRLGKEVGPYDFNDLCTVGEEVKRLCAEHGLKILVLQPFSNFEGWSEGSKEREDAFVRARGWIRIMQAVGTDMLQVGSSDSPSSKISTSQDRIVSDLTELANLLAPHSFRLAYENWCWSTHAPTWSSVWSIVKAINLPNVGLCLDTFQIAGLEWADPCTTSGLNEDHPWGERGCYNLLEASLDKLIDEVPPEKIFFLQISDAYKPPKPFSKETDGDGLRPRGRWSHDFRPIPYSEGGYLPVTEVLTALLSTGYKGWLSMEVFDSGPDGKGKEYDLGDFAKVAMEAHRKLVAACSTEETYMAIWGEKLSAREQRQR